LDRRRKEIVNETRDQLNVKINFNYLALTFVLFVTEVLIALYVNDSFIRPYGGDILVVMLIYCFIKSFFDIKVWKAAAGVLLFSFAIETLQYFQIVSRLHLENSKIARTVIGSSFSWADIGCYIVGIIMVISVEMLFNKEQK